MKHAFVEASLHQVGPRSLAAAPRDTSREGFTAGTKRTGPRSGLERIKQAHRVPKEYVRPLYCQDVAPSPHVLEA